MSSRLNWSTYEPAFDVYARDGGMPLPKAIAELGEVIRKGVSTGKLMMNELLAHLVERTWHGMGRPSYRVALPLAEALANTDLDLDAALVRFPHAAFALELPRDFELVNRGGHRLMGLLVSALHDSTDGTHRELEVAEPNGVVSWRLLVLQSWEDEDGIPVVFTLSLKPGDRIATRIAEIESEAGFSPGHDPSITGADALHKIMALALGAAFFAVGANTALVKPLGKPPGKQKRKGRRADRRPPEPRRWSLGADIQLPRRSDRSGTEPSDESTPGRSLTWGHIRQGHLRMTPTGPRDKPHYVIRYIAPARVRPDLPLAPRATRHALDQP